MKEVKELLKDENVNIFINKYNDLEVNVYSYDRSLLEYKEYVNKLFYKIVELKEDILEYYNKNHFIISIDNYSIDGLFESNSLLINDNSILVCKY